MIRAVLSASQRAAKLPHAVLLMKSMDNYMLVQTKLHQSQLRSLQLMRCFASSGGSGDDRIKGAAGANQGGIIGSVGSEATMGQATGVGDAATVQQMAGATYGARSDKLDKQQSEGATKPGNITSQMHATATPASSTECGNIGTDECKSSKPIGQSTGGTVNNLADDAVKQLQEAAANLPSKEQIEKFVFRVLAFVYDIIYLTGTWTIRFVNEKIIKNATVKYYWQRFHEKMEQAKKD